KTEACHLPNQAVQGRIENNSIGSLGSELHTSTQVMAIIRGTFPSQPQNPLGHPPSSPRAGYQGINERLIAVYLAETQTSNVTYKLVFSVLFLTKSGSPPP